MKERDRAEQKGRGREIEEDQVETGKIDGWKKLQLQGNCLELYHFFTHAVVS